MLIHVVKSELKNKRFKAIFTRKDGTIYKSVHFGSPPPSRGFIDHGDKRIRRAYIARHKELNEDWTDLYSAGALSRFLIWGHYPDLNKNIERYQKKLDRLNI